MRLRIVKAAFDGEVVDVGRAHRGHLAALHIAHPAFGVEHEDFGSRTACDRMDRGRSGITAGRADNRQTLVTALKENLEQVAEQLQRHILERQRRAVEQFEQPVLLIELHQRGHRGVGEFGAVDLLANGGQFRLGQAVTDEGAHHGGGDLPIGQPAQGADLGFAETRPFDGQIEAAIAGEARERNPFEIERRCAAACRDILHGSAG